MGKADLHIHTTHSWDGTASVSAVLKQAHDYTNLNVIAITDHDQVSGSLEAQALSSQYNIEVITGSEITTDEGHLLALFIEKNIPAGLSLLETLQRIASQGGIAIAAHPTARWTGNFSENSLRAALKHPEAGSVLKGIEVYNGSLVDWSANRTAQEMGKRLPLAEIGSSDAHIHWMVGKGITIFEGTTALDLRKAIENQSTQAIKTSSLLTSGRGILDWSSRRLIRTAGWVAVNSQPEHALVFGRETTTII